MKRVKTGSFWCRKGLVYRRGAWDIPEDVMGCLIAVGDFSPMVGLACPRNFGVCNACRSKILTSTSMAV